LFVNAFVARVRPNLPVDFEYSAHHTNPTILDGFQVKMAPVAERPAAIFNFVQERDGGFQSLLGSCTALRESAPLL
jgi:hypothetical protein